MESIGEHDHRRKLYEFGIRKKIVQLRRHGLPRYIIKMDEYGYVNFDDLCWLVQRFCERDGSLYTGTIVGTRSRRSSGGDPSTVQATVTPELVVSLMRKHNTKNQFSFIGRKRPSDKYWEVWKVRAI